MSRKASYLKIGIFVTAGVIVTVVGIVWVGASSYFAPGAGYVTYFNESVQGLQRDSIVKYRGVDIGRVINIGVAPDNNLVEVSMKISFGDGLPPDIVSQLKSAGITGIVFIELDRKKIDERDASPRLGFRPQYPVIPSRPSEIRQIITTFTDIIDSIKQIDFHGISDNIKDTLAATEETLRVIENRISDKRVETTLSRLETTATNLAEITGNAKKTLEKSGLDTILRETKTTLTDTRRLINDLDAATRSLKLAETSDKVRGVLDKTGVMMDNLNARTSDAGHDIKAVTENLRRATESLERVLERLEASPSDIILSRPPANRERR